MNLSNIETAKIMGKEKEMTDKCSLDVVNREKGPDLSDCEDGGVMKPEEKNAYGAEWI